MVTKRPLKISVFQSACGNAPVARLLDALEKTVVSASAQGADLVVCPELFLGGYRAGSKHAERAAEGDEFAAAVSGIAKRQACAIAYGYPEPGPERCYNAAQVIGCDGIRLARHRKTQLPSDYEKQWFQMAATEGGLTLFNLCEWRIALIVCYEVEFPEVVRVCALHGADLVLVPTALSYEWPVVARAVVPARAFENGVFLAYANHAGEDQGYRFLGESCILGPQGQELARAGDLECVISATLDPALIGLSRKRIPFLEDCRELDRLSPRDDDAL